MQDHKSCKIRNTLLIDKYTNLIGECVLLLFEIHSTFLPQVYLFFILDLNAFSSQKYGI